jgi:hypothetical protein
MATYDQRCHAVIRALEKEGIREDLPIESLDVVRFAEAVLYALDHMREDVR